MSGRVGGMQRARLQCFPHRLKTPKLTLTTTRHMAMAAIAVSYMAAMAPLFQNKGSLPPLQAATLSSSKQGRARMIAEVAAEAPAWYAAGLFVDPRVEGILSMHGDVSRTQLPRSNKSCGLELTTRSERETTLPTDPIMTPTLFYIRMNPDTHACHDACPSTQYYREPMALHEYCCTKALRRTRNLRAFKRPMQYRVG